MLGSRLIDVAAVALSVFSLATSSVQSVRETGRVLRANCPDFDASKTTDTSLPTETSASTSSHADIGSASASTSLEADETPDETSILTTVVLYTEENLQGDAFPVTVTGTNRCYTFEASATSAQWTAGDFDSIWFFTSSSCDMMASEYASFFASQLIVNGFDTLAIKSFILSKTPSSVGVA